MPHPDFALVTAEYIVVANEGAGGIPAEINLIPYQLIVRMEMLPGKNRKAA